MVQYSDQVRFRCCVVEAPVRYASDVELAAARLRQVRYRFVRPEHDVVERSGADDARDAAVAAAEQRRVCRSHDELGRVRGDQSGRSSQLRLGRRLVAVRFADDAQQQRRWRPRAEQQCDVVGRRQRAHAAGVTQQQHAVVVVDEQAENVAGLWRRAAPAAAESRPADDGRRAGDSLAAATAALAYVGQRDFVAAAQVADDALDGVDVVVGHDAVGIDDDVRQQQPRRRQQRVRRLVVWRADARATLKETQEL